MVRDGRLCGLVPLLGWLLSAGCVTPSQVIVHVTSDSEAANNARFLRLEVFASDGRAVPSYSQTEEFGSELQPLDVAPVELTVVPRDSDASRTFRVVATLVDASRRDFSYRAAISSFVPGEQMEIWLHFDDACAEVECDGRQTCNIDDEGVPACMDACVTPSSPGSVVRSELQSCGTTCDFAEEGGVCDEGTGRCWLGACCHTCFDGERCLDDGERSEAATGASGAECVACDCPGDGERPDGGCSGPVLRGLGLGTEHACVSFDGETYCWGNNDAGQVGNGEMGGVVPAPIFVADGLGQAALGSNHSCAFTPAGDATCWGEGTRFQLGQGASGNIVTPREATVDGGAFERMAAGQVHTCGVRTDGVYCWGGGSDGQTGVAGLDEGSGPVSAPTLVLPGNVTSMATTRRTTCAIADGGLYCWGYNDSGGVGVPSEMVRIYEPVETGQEKAGTWREVSVSPFGVCALDETGRLFCRGQVRTDITLDFGGELPEEEHVIFQIGTERWRTIELGAHFLCGIQEPDDALVCLGQNDQGQLGGDGSARVQHGPVGMRWKRIGSGDNFACAVRQDDTLWCWGNNAFGQLGTSDPADTHSDLPEPPASSIFSLEPRRVCHPVGM